MVKLGWRLYWGWVDYQPKFLGWSRKYTQPNLTQTMYTAIEKYNKIVEMVKIGGVKMGG